MTHRTTLRLFLILTLWGMMTTTANAQGQCPVVDRVVSPVDPDGFIIVQDYGVRSVRHEGRYHAGEDWVLPNGTSEGQPVRAVANGRVTYAYPQGWGDDGGVVILEHTLPDERILYTLYGHLQEANGITFPAGTSCVSAGDIIGVISDARPVAHLHLEVRVSNGRSPATGYTDTPPDEAGYRRPSQTLTNISAQLNRTVDWVTTIPPQVQSDPVVLNDNSILVLEPRSISRILPDGRLFWRTSLDRPAVALSTSQGSTLIHYADGIIQRITPDGTLDEFWQTNTRPIGAPFALDTFLIFPQADNTLIGLDDRRRDTTWTANNIPPFTHATLTTQLIGLRDANHQLTTLSRQGQILNRAEFGAWSSLAASPDGTLTAYTETGLWQILTDGVWSPLMTDAPPLVGHSATVTSPNGIMWLFNGETLFAYNRDGTLRQNIPLSPAPHGRATLTATDERPLLITAGGDILTLTDNNTLCRLHIWGKTDGHLWHTWGADGTLRVQIGDTLIGIDASRFTTDCPT